MRRVMAEAVEAARHHADPSLASAPANPTVGNQKPPEQLGLAAAPATKSTDPTGGGGGDSSLGTLALVGPGRKDFEHFSTGWTGGCPGAEIAIKTQSKADQWRQRSQGALARATSFVKTRKHVRETMIDPENKGTPYQVVWLEGVKEFRGAASLTADRFKPRPPAPGVPLGPSPAAPTVHTAGKD